MRWREERAQKRSGAETRLHENYLRVKACFDRKVRCGRSKLRNAIKCAGHPESKPKFFKIIEISLTGSDSGGY